MMFSIVIILIGFASLAFFAGIEMSFVSSNKLKMRHKAEKGSPSARIVVEMSNQPQLFLASVLLYQNVSHVMLTAAFAYLLEEAFHISDPLVDTAILAPFVVIFAEMLPKEVCRRKADELILISAHFLHFLLRATAPLVDYVIGLSNRIIRKLEGTEPKRSAFVSRNELKALIHESARKGIVLEHERRLIDKIFEFENRPVSEIMQPLTAVSRISIHEDIGSLKLLARKNRSDAFWAVAYENEVANVVGIVHLFDVLFEENESTAIRPFVRMPLFIRSTTSTEEAFLLLQSKRQTKAVVIDNSSRAVGMITIHGLIQF
ncbi:MAG: DUF21 domain-containing protein [Candidatus Omnitrophica bacterium]|nr:DUF21 domain-containing protein [Candidatus Omnitrophota bacterium]